MTQEENDSIPLLFYIGEASFSSIEDFSKHLQYLYNKSLPDFETVCQHLITPQLQLEEKFETWLIALGRINELSTWKEQLSSAFK